MTLLEYLKNYTNKNTTPFHMPGHKRNTQLAQYLQTFGAEYDLTEIYSMDDLHAPEGIIKECQQNAEKLWNSNHSYFLVNGSTCGILAGIRACTKNGDRVLVARNCHKSVYNAIELCNLNPTYIIPDLLEGLPIYSSLNPQTIYNKLSESFKNGEKISLLILTSPTYEGVISDVAQITEIAHSFNVPVLVDEAHGSHLDLSEHFTGGAVKAGADIVIQSLHKTLPSLTQTAIVHLNSKIVTANQLQRQLSVFQTSSPSYLLMSSIDSCVNLIKNNSALFESWNENLNTFKKEISRFTKLSVLDYTAKNNYFLFDKSKIVISTANTDINAVTLMDILRTRFNIELEMCSGDYAIAMTSMADSKDDFNKLAHALNQIDISISESGRKSYSLVVSSLPEAKATIQEALSCDYVEVDINNAIGKASAEYVWIYPPGIPIITPGEVITEEAVSIIRSADENSLNLQKTITDKADIIAVLA
ncbi:MAG: aminotransferase class I/II-fold pyridoxal phosphate-dependent enzyme [Acutalibacteraceae bacterium]|nr:aminotransferase class I/II-fold pyridoxal phosphate-dependent enzyme [Acutalibacteraceae bacterium]